MNAEPKPLATWPRDFYAKQHDWSGLGADPVDGVHRQRAARVAELAGPGAHRVLELGAGGGQTAAAMAEAGHMVVAVELVPELAALARARAGDSADQGSVRVIQGDFYEIQLEGDFDVVCYWDGFGIGADEDQRRLLRRIRGWLRTGGKGLVDVYTPWHAAQSAGRSGRVGDAERRYGFDAAGCRWLDTWWPEGRPDEAVTQSLRCYSPADLGLLCEPTELRIERVIPGGVFDWEARRWIDEAPLEQAMSYLAVLVKK